MAKRSPTSRALEHYRELGYLADKTEHHNMFSHQKNDLFGFIDLVAIHPVRGIVGVQATSGANHAARRTKILALPTAVAWIAAGGIIEVITFAKQGARGKPKRWTTRIEVITADMFQLPPSLGLNSSPA
jgi:hypothetical protein